MGGGGGDSAAGPPASTAPDAGAAPAAEEAACVLTPEQAEGPFYVPDAPVRGDIAEGREGVPLELRLVVQDAASCAPIPGATVEVWHCDALGDYSGVDDVTIFLRGAPRTDAAGEAVFRTIYPGRTTHVHVKAHVGGAEVHTGQLYFDEAVTRAVYARAPYSSRGQATTTNASDGIYAAGGAASTLALSRAGEGYVGRITMAVRTA